MAEAKIPQLPRTRNLPDRLCTVYGCVSVANRKAHGWCEMHYGRMRRNGNFDPPFVGKWTEASHGYMVRQDGSHPLSGKNGLLYQHRAVLFEAIGGGVHSCHWCRAEIEWKAKGGRKLVVDHIDGHKRNNVPGNLVPSCHRCNATRGLFQKWVMEHRDDPFLWALFEQARAA